MSISMDFKPQAFFNTGTQALRQTSKLILQNLDRSDRIKLSSLPVYHGQTYTSLQVQIAEQLQTHIHTRYPDHVVLLPHTLSELSHEQESSDFIWIVEPLDGIDNFLRDIPIFCLSLTLQYQSQTLVSFVYDPIQDTLFTALNQNSAKMNDKRIRCHNRPHKTPPVLGLYQVRGESIQQHIPTATTRSLGSLSLSLCYLAAGKFDVFYAENIHARSLAAAEAIALEAKAVIYKQVAPGNTNHIRKLLCLGPPELHHIKLT